jgi:hypothetical protein
VTGGSVTGGSVTGGSVTGGSVTGGLMTGGSIVGGLVVGWVVDVFLTVVLGLGGMNISQAAQSPAASTAQSNKDFRYFILPPFEAVLP